MAEQNFSWLPDESAFKVNESIRAVDPSESEPSFGKKIVEKLFLQKTGLVVLALLLVALFTVKFFQKADSPPLSRLEVMTAVMPVPKGKVIEGMLLRPVLVSPGSFSKTQRLELLTSDGAEKIVGKVRAKKDIPPNVPIFWNELELLPEPSLVPKILIPKVIFGG